ncbi:MAG TPA: family 20 glycosylhydrolase [Lysobacter sp.]|nr:family 20 glycosylhydrolase [Lysobacter sp.]
MERGASMRLQRLLTAAAGIALLLCGNAAPAAQAARADTAVLPLPARVLPGQGEFVLDARTRLSARGGAEAVRIAGDLAGRLAASRGFAPRVVEGAPGTGDVSLVLDPTAALPGDEAYRLEIGPTGAVVTARAPGGLFYGAVSLWQLATADGGTGAARIAAQRIDDAPRFPWRGLMLDVARHVRSIDEIKALIDQMALHKLNTLHWHLTDDQGWRIEIKRYPRLTEVGSCRTPAGAAGRDADGAPRRYCGFYTQDQIRDVVRYAAARNITVVPEIDLPGHAQAAIAAYPQLGVTGRTPPVSPDWGVHTWLFNADESTFEFLEGVLDEVMALFPARYVHLGGDEAAKDQWRQSAAIQARIRELGLKDEMQLQSWFMTRLGRYLQAHDRRMLGWDEILEGGVPPDATVMSWRGLKGAIEAARAGHDVVLSPAPDLYLDHVQSARGDEIGGRLAVRSLQDTYAFQPLPSELTPAQLSHVLGAQANLWTEHMRTGERVQRAAFPRASALAEVLWTPAERHGWTGFLERLVPMRARWAQADFRASDSAFVVAFAPSPAADGGARVDLSTQTGFGTIRYTLDGSAPTALSPAYTAPLALPVAGQVVTATAFSGDRALAAPRRLTLDVRSLRARGSHALRPCKAGLVLRLEDDAPFDGPRALMTTDVFDPCWIYPQADVAGARQLAVRVGQVPFNFQLAGDAKNVVTRPAAASGPALEVRADRCDAPVIARLPLAPAQGSDGVTELRATLPALTGPRDLCLIFAAGSADPIWTIDEVALLP